MKDSAFITDKNMKRENNLYFLTSIYRRSNHSFSMNLLVLIRSLSIIFSKPSFFIILTRTFNCFFLMLSKCSN